MKTVLADGCFDLLHYGHVLHLKAARKLGDRLVVGLTPDEMIHKGEGRPVFPYHVRELMLRELRCVDDVVRSVDSYHALKKVQPDIFVKGKEYEGKIEPHHFAYCYENNIQIIFTDTEVYSSTKLLHYYESASR